MGGVGLVAPGYIGLAELGASAWLFAPIIVYLLAYWWREGVSVRVLAQAFALCLLVTPYSRGYDDVVLILPSLACLAIPGGPRRWLGLVLVIAASAFAQPPATNVDDARMYEVGSQLRCVVCQNLSVADSPSEMAHQMRGIVRDRLRAGESPDQVVEYFVDKYGEWILLKPRRHGFNWLVWLAPSFHGGMFSCRCVMRWERSTPMRPLLICFRPMVNPL